MLGDKAYDNAELREELDECGTKPVIPNRSNRKQPFGFSKRLYKLRWRIESAFNRLKDFRRIATRYDKLARTPRQERYHAPQQARGEARLPRGGGFGCVLCIRLKEHRSAFPSSAPSRPPAPDRG
jgi:hypothetical protein